MRFSMRNQVPNLQLRKATLDDAKMLFEWYNDPVTRKNSRNSNSISYEEHIAWFTKALQNPLRLLYIAEDNSIAVGTIRAEKGKDNTELSWTIAPNMRSKGYGKAMVCQFASQMLANDKLVACIEEGNLASEHIAKALGLTKAEPENVTDKRRFMIWR